MLFTKIFCIYVFLGFLHNSSQLALYQMTSAPENKWKDKIYHTESAISLEQCAAHCNLIVTGSYSCNIFSWDGNTCYIGNIEKTATSNIAVPGDISQIYIDPCTCGYIYKVEIKCISVFLTAFIPPEEAEYLIVENITANQFSRLN